MATQILDYEEVSSSVIRKTRVRVVKGKRRNFEILAKDFELTKCRGRVMGEIYISLAEKTEVRLQ